MPNEPERIKAGRYTLVRRLGEGSQGETFEARDNGLVGEGRANPAELSQAFRLYVARAKGAASPASRTVAIKRFRIARAKEWKDVELAEREATTLASLDHRRLPKYIEHFEEDGALYLVMEMIEGESLASIRARRGRFDVGDVTRMLEDLGDALRYLHAQAPPVVHRDIKPGNVIRRPDGSFALVDFGSVRDRLKPAGGSTVVGTFGYMAPEQFQGRAAPKSDVYAVAATALAMLTGQEPEELPHVGLGIDVARALPRRTPRKLAKALAAMLEPDPDRRASSIDEALSIVSSKKPKRRRSRPKEKRGRKAQPREQARSARALAKEKTPPRRSRAREYLLSVWFVLLAYVLIYKPPHAIGQALLLLLPLVGLGLSIAARIRRRRAELHASTTDASAEPRVRVANDANETTAVRFDEPAEDEEHLDGDVRRRSR